MEHPTPAFSTHSDKAREEREEAEIAECLSDIDWEQMLDDEENDGPEAYVFDSSRYATDEEAMAALEAVLYEAMERGIRAAREAPLHVTRG